jgi:uncharacterized YigZ family protein
LESRKVDRYPVPGQEVRHEMVVANSRFIATLAPVFNVEQARAFIARLRSEFADASHNVPAYIIGHGSTLTEHCSDDGEPSGTAGRPALAVLKGSGLGDAAVVVTRYFGGTKLGTGGLVRAYSEAVRLVVESVPRAELIPTCTILIGLPYNWLERLRRLVVAHGGRVLDEDFAVDITLTARFPAERLPDFQAALRQASNATLEALLISTEEELTPIPPR